MSPSDGTLIVLPVAVDEDLVRVVRIEARCVRAALAAGAVHARVALAAVHALSAQHGAPGGDPD